jgi:hypothetical protein
MTQSRAVTGLLTGYSIVTKRLYLMALTNSNFCGRCGAGDETPVYMLSECEALHSLTHTYVFSFFLDPEDIESLTLRAIWNLAKERSFV